MERPRILVTRAEEIVSERWEDYGDRVREAGAEPFAGTIQSWLAGVAPPEHDGLMLTAGVDVDPARYGQPRAGRVLDVDPRRDQWETALIEAAHADGRPLLAICRGHQLFNVARGGSLLQHLEQREPHRARRGADGESIDSGWHGVATVPGTLLARVLDAASVRVNSRHHQAVTVEGVAPGLTVAATTPDGVVEALEDPTQPWALSVQWHPEMTEMADARGRLFEAFVEACAAFASARPRRAGG